jgi:prepilin-type N-terminal cleavage/methylation domain-containing protein
MARRAFTLIELLIVVAIISILAAIALPNFLEAQTRAKVSRAKADLRSIATALEAYRLDLNDYPPSRGPAVEQEPVHVLNGYGEPCDGAFRTVSLRLSTPIAYLTNSSIADPFKRGGSERGGRAYASGNPADLAYGYHNVYQLAIVDMAAGWYPDDYYADYGYWRLFSVGPAMTYPAFGSGNLGWFYDPTNGTISDGGIVRTSKDPEGLHLAIPDP